jgi:hypothetical protein
MKYTPEQVNAAIEDKWLELKAENMPLHSDITPAELLEASFKAGMRAGLNFTKPRGNRGELDKV